jgi:hypothetical protein
MKDLIALMNSKTPMSSVVLYYHWMHKNYIVSIRLLIDHIGKHYKIIAQDVYYCTDAFKETKSLSTISKEGRMRSWSTEDSQRLLYICSR